MSDCFSLHIIIRTAAYTKYFSSKTKNMESKLGILVWFLDKTIFKTAQTTRYYSSVFDR